VAGRPHFCRAGCCAGVLADDRRAAEEALGDALAAVRDPWEPETTARNLRLIRDVRSKRGHDVAWIEAVERELHAHTTPRRTEVPGDQFRLAPVPHVFTGTEAVSVFS
jgi:hypothetical protein